jgi:hypothetical protein
MPIIDMSLDSDTLAAKITASVDQIADGIGNCEGGKIYVVGSADDFDEICAPLIDQLPNVVGSACIWAKLRPSPIFPTNVDVIITGNYIEPGKDGCALVLCQSVVALPEQIIAAASQVLETFDASQVVLAAVSIAPSARTELARFFHERYGIEARFVSLEDYPVPAPPLTFHHRFVDLIDNRPKRDFPVMPEWVLDRIKGNGEITDDE